MNTNLSGKFAVVCGSTQGIGRASALSLAELGATVILLARDQAKLDRVCEELSTAYNQSHRVVVADFFQTGEVHRAITDIVQQQPQIHILVNNTGGPPGGQAIDAPISAYEAAFRNHLINNQVLVQAVVPCMRAVGYGRIINIISTSVKQPIPGLGVSNTIRGAVANWAKTLAAELGPMGITVNNVLPGFTRTTRLEALIASKAEAAGRSIADVTQDMVKQVPLRRFADPTEIAAAVAFLASPAASYISGINLPVDGGRTESL